MIITNLPVETIDLIAAALDSPTDTRNLAAVCTQLRLLLEPHHTQFRVIRSPLISPIWEKIAENRLFARNIRVLEIQSAEIYEDWQVDVYARLDKPIIPAIFQELEIPSVPVPNGGEVSIKVYNVAKNAMYLDAERTLVSALKGMSSLTSFLWACTPPLINHNQEDDIWTTLAKYCTSLNVIDVFDYIQPNEFVPTAAALNPNLYSLKDLKSFSLYTEAFNHGNFVFPDMEKCAEMLIGKCPNLEILKLDYTLFMNPVAKAVPASPLFTGPPWSSLRELTLHCFDFIATELASCLAAHPIIEILSLTSTKFDQSLVLPPGVLPRLKQLFTGIGSTLARSVLDSITSTPRPLKYIQGSSLNDVFLDSLEHSGSGPSLENLDTVCGDDHDLNHLLARLSGIAPNLQWLDVNRYSTLPFDHILYTAFGQLPRLRTLEGIRFVHSSCVPAENTESIRALVTACPNLERISWYIGTSRDDDSSVLIERNGSHVTWSLRNRLRGVDSSICLFWGERSRGSFQL